MIPHLHRRAWSGQLGRPRLFTATEPEDCFPGCLQVRSAETVHEGPMPSILKLLRPLMPAGQWVLVPKGHSAWASQYICGRHASSISSPHLGTNFI